MADYVKYLKKSWEETKENPLLFVPKLVSMILSAIVLLFFLYQTGIIKMFLEGKLSYNGIFSSIESFLIYFGLYLLIEFCIVSFFSAVSYGMYKDIINDKTTNLKKGLAYGIKYFKEVVGITIISYLVIGIPLIVMIYSIKVRIISNGVLNSVVIAISILILLYYLFLVVLRLFFVYAAMMFSKKDTLSTIHISAHFGKTHFKHTLITWLIILGIGSLFEILRKPSIFLSSQINLFWIIVIIAIFSIAEIIISVWENLFIFNMYLKSK